MSGRFVGFVCGLRSEQQCLEGAGLGERVRTAAAGLAPSRAEALAGTFAADGAAALVSFGVAGALAPELAPGDLVIPSRIVSLSGETWPVDGGLIEAFAAAAAPRGLPYHDGAALGVAEMVVTSDAKRQLHERSGALAVDMESLAVARSAAAAAVPFLAVRAIVDPASRAIPPSARVGLGPDGRHRPFAVAAHTLTRPQDLPALLRLWRDNAAAHATLRRVARGLLPEFLGGL